MRPQRAVPGLAVALVLASGCTDARRPAITAPGSAPLDTLAGLIVSQPVSGPSAASGLARVVGAASSAGSGVVYVSMVPGTVPTGLLATIRDHENGSSVTAPVVDGGFDPVAIPATVGDTLVVEISRSGSLGPVRAVELVKASRPPVVVRTSPPNGGRDVPLNACLVLVFSDPIDPATLTTNAVQLWRGTSAVPGTVDVGDSVGIRLEFRPDSLLAGQADYRLVATRTLSDVDGLRLDSAVDVTFTTGTSVAPAVASLSFEYDLPNAIAGLPMWGEVLVKAVDAQGNLAAGFNGTIRISIGANPGGGTLSGTKTVSAISGEAAFVDLGIDRAGSGYTLVASAVGPSSGTSTAFDVEPSIGPTTNLVAFTTGTFETGLVDPDGGGLATLHVSGRNPFWSPDGKKIAFSPAPTGAAGGGWWLGVMNADGSGAVYVPQFDFCAAWSPDATKLAGFRWPTSTANDAGIYVVNADGSNLTRLVGTGETCPVWSPDGTKIAFGPNRLFVMNADGTGVTQLTGDSINVYGPVAWSPDGKRIAFPGLAPGAPAGIYVISADGSGLTLLIQGDSLNELNEPLWSPDGRKIAYWASAVGVADIYVMNGDGSGSARVTAGMMAYLGGWSPDGTRIVFDGKATPDALGQIYVVDLDGSNLKAVTPARQGTWSDGEWPSWRP